MGVFSQSKVLEPDRPLDYERLLATKEASQAILTLSYAMNNLAAAIDRHAIAQYYPPLPDETPR